MVLWQCELRVSWRAQLISLLLHGIAILALLLAPWPASYTLVWMLLLTLVVLECVRSQRRIRSRKGNITLLTGRQLRWRHQQWHLAARPWSTRQTMLLTLQSSNRRRERLWLFADSMENNEWRLLRQQLLMQRDVDNE